MWLRAQSWPSRLWGLWSGLGSSGVTSSAGGNTGGALSYGGRMRVTSTSIGDPKWSARSTTPRA